MGSVTGRWRDLVSFTDAPECVLGQFEQVHGTSYEDAEQFEQSGDEENREHDVDDGDHRLRGRGFPFAWILGSRVRGISERGSGGAFRRAPRTASNWAFGTLGIPTNRLYFDRSIASRAFLAHNQ